MIYGSWPPVTSIKLGGRTIQADRAVSVKIRLLEFHEDKTFWCSKSQHSHRVNLGLFHRDFADTEVAYSFSSPQTHVFISGYSIHFEAFENLAFSSYNATVRARPEHVLGDRVLYGTEDLSEAMLEFESSQSACSPRVTRSSDVAGKRASILKERPKVTRRMSKHKEGFIYSSQVPVVSEDPRGFEIVEYQYTASYLNDCERDISSHQDVSIGVGITSTASPVSVPPRFPPLQPYELKEAVVSTDQYRHASVPVVRSKGKTKIPPFRVSQAPRIRNGISRLISEKVYGVGGRLCRPSDKVFNGGDEDDQSDQNVCRYRPYRMPRSGYVVDYRNPNNLAKLRNYRNQPVTEEQLRATANLAKLGQASLMPSIRRSDGFWPMGGVYPSFVPIRQASSPLSSQLGRMY